MERVRESGDSESGEGKERGRSDVYKALYLINLDALQIYVLA